MRPRRWPLLAALFTVLLLVSSGARAQCPEEPRLDNFVGGGRVSCPCFVSGEQAGAIFHLPEETFPIEILRVGIGWGSMFGGSPASLEDSVLIYPGGLPDPGDPVFTLSGPQLIDGAINEFNLESFPGEIIIDSSPFTVTLRFLNGNSGNPYLPSTVHDGTSCQPGKNVVFAIPGGWSDGCSLGISGQWVFYVVYRKVNCGGAGSVPDGRFLPGTPLRAERAGGDDIELAWSASCEIDDDDYAVYEGDIGSFYSHEARFCTTGGETSLTFTPEPGSTYYLVVPRQSDKEGSYGRKGDSSERPPGSPACTVQEPISCP
jgi:hypothetical protein